MNRHVLWTGPEPYTPGDVADVAAAVARLTGVTPTPPVVESVLDSLHASYRPRTGDIHTRLLLSDEIPDQFSGRQSVNAEAVVILARAVTNVPSILDATASFSPWHRPDVNRYDAPKLNLRRPPPSIAMRY